MFSMVDYANNLLNQYGKATSSESHNDTSRCGFEVYKPYSTRGREYVQYEYRTEQGELFSMIGKTLEDCRLSKDEWLNELKEQI